ncbi:MULTISPECIES: transcriptional regulator GcvA [Roseovarius]|uniref:transcriptional regulator GcvA n=1 Tax=Roseovarius TaxID=74030 RepID=UPI001C97A0C8|nr:transcriptional regulator GcvA [Roseovarius atlanticus]MBY6122918.1 transcriptional regulator GcvA [Roseovarius atlanticus]
MRKLPSLNALRTFEVAARTLSFSLAAEELSVTQAAVSRQIRVLEEDLGVKLFRRLTRAVELTEEGETLYPVLRDAFYQIERATARIWGNKGTGILTISVLPTFAVKWLIPRLMHFSDLHPQIEVHLVNSIKPVDFEREEIDLAIRVGTPGILEHVEDKPRIDLTMTRSWEGLEASEIMVDELVMVASPGYIEARGRVETVEDLQDVTLLHTATRPNAWKDFLGSLRWSFDTSGGLSYGHFFMTIQAAIDGRGIAVVPYQLVEADLRNGSVEIAHPEKVASAGSYYLIGRKRSWDQRRIKIFRQWLLSELEREV